MPKVILTNIRTVEIEIAAGSRDDQEKAITEKTRSKETLVWIDDPKGVKAVVIDGHKVWRPRDTFKLGE